MYVSMKKQPKKKMMMGLLCEANGQGNEKRKRAKGYFITDPKNTKSLLTYLLFGVTLFFSFSTLFFWCNLKSQARTMMMMLKKKAK